MIKISQLVSLLLAFNSLASIAAAPDSLFTIELNGNHYILHQIEKGETLYGISKLYQANPEQLVLLNEHILGSSIAVGDVLRIPIEKLEEPKFRPEMIYHEVRAGETLYSIRQKYDNASMDSLLAWNELNIDTLSLGQMLIVGRKPFYDPLAILPNEYVKHNFLDLQSAFFSKRDTAHRLISELQIATWVNSAGARANNNLYALHKHQPRGTILKVTNLINDHVVFVKVIGKMPELPGQENVQLNMSAAAVQSLDARDPRIVVEVEYFQASTETVQLQD